jgi:hypothetical protein
MLHRAGVFDLHNAVIFGQVEKKLMTGGCAGNATLPDALNFEGDGEC